MGHGIRARFAPFYVKRDTASRSFPFQRQAGAFTQVKNWKPEDHRNRNLASVERPHRVYTRVQDMQTNFLQFKRTSSHLLENLAITCCYRHLKKRLIFGYYPSRVKLSLRPFCARIQGLTDTIWKCFQS